MLISDIGIKGGFFFFNIKLVAQDVSCNSVETSCAFVLGSKLVAIFLPIYVTQKSDNYCNISLYSNLFKYFCNIWKLLNY